MSVPSSNDPMKRTPGGHYSVGALPSSYQVTPDVLDGNERHHQRKSTPPGDQTRESQLEAVKDNPPRAPTTQRPSSFTLKTRACGVACRPWVGTYAAPASSPSTLRRAPRRSAAGDREGRRRALPAASAAAYRAEGVRAELLLAMEISIQTSGFAVVLVGHLMQFGATVFRWGNYC
jgi:hypothetical protein